MIRQLININNLPYVVELYDAYRDNIVHYEQFIMFRQYNVYNDVFADKELYFVDKSLWDNNKDSIIWPINEELGGGFSRNYKHFNDLFSTYGLEHGYDINILYNRFKNIANVRCNMVRIYRPTMKSKNNALIHIDNFINNVHMHYLCRTYDSYNVHSDNEFTLNNITYSEYIELYFPNVYDLFDNDKLNNHIGCYFKENLNAVELFSNIKHELLLIDEEDKYVYFPLDIFSLPYTLKEKINDDNETYLIKCYSSIARSIENNYLTYPVNISMWMYSDEIINDKYVKDTRLGEASAVFMQDLKFTLNANLGFVDNKVSVIATFNFPDRKDFENKYDNEAVINAYMKYNNVKKEHYENFKIEAIEQYSEELDKTVINDSDAIIVKDYFKRKGENVDVTKYDILKEKYKEMKLQSLYDEMIENINGELDFIGFRIIIGSDINFDHIIYDQNVKIKFNELDDFAFNINDIFEEWNNVYDGYYAARIIFIDRLLGTEIVSNSVILSPEWIKYMIHSSNERIMEFNNIDVKDIDDDMIKYNFLENIRCVVNKKSNNDNTVIRSGGSPKILYKPIFYKVNELQNVKIRRNIKQKIGINLAEYMTKVSQFKMLINGVEYTEYGRADAYVIFEISGNNFSSSAGMYDILNQDDEYISSGNYSLI